MMTLVYVDVATAAFAITACAYNALIFSLMRHGVIHTRAVCQASQDKR